jgi:hypothetical protein
MGEVRNGYEKGMKQLASQRYPEDIRLRIKEGREWLGLSQQGLAGECRCSLEAIKKLEQKGKGSAAFIRKVIRVCNELLVAEGELPIWDPVTPAPAAKGSWIRPPQRHPRWEHLGPGALLDPLNRFVSFHGHSANHELPNLRSWCRSEGPYALRAFAAKGGVGKTRLAVELCRSLLPEWDAGFLDLEAFETHWSDSDGFGSLKRPLLVVVDYAGDPRKTVALQRLLGALPKHEGPRVCLLMLERDPLWLLRLRSRKEVADVLDGPAMAGVDLDEILRPVTRTADERRSSFAMAAKSFSRALKPGSRLQPLPPGPARPTSSIYDQLLFLHAEALDRVAGAPEPAGTRVACLRRMLARERDYWRRMFPARGLPLDLLGGFEAAVVAIGEKGGVEGGKEAEAILKALPDFKSAPTSIIRQTALLLREVYPDDRKGIAPLQPDLLGQCLADEWLAVRGSSR